MKPLALKFWLSNAGALLSVLASHPAVAQIVPDATLPNNSIVTPQGNTRIIEGGTSSGGNLFHSFLEFSVPTGSEAFFNNALNVQNIFSRVTGRSISNIDGLIRANGTANLFLLNPNGIIFGPNARLNIGGSFLASTANSIKFADGTEFSATNPQTPPLLSINVPIGLQYGKNAAEIRVQGKGQDLGNATESFDSSLNPLEVLPGKSLAIVGGNVIVDGGILQAPGGRVELGGVAGEGTVGLNADGSLSFPDGIARADVSISNKAGINVIASGGGSITISAKNLDISQKSVLSAGIATGKGSTDATAGDISLSATEAIKISSTSRIENLVNPADDTGVLTIGNSGNINIQTGSLSLTDGAALSTSTFGLGDAGNIKISATDTVSFDRSNAFSTVQREAIGKGGNIEITTGTLFVTNGAQLQTITAGRGDAGNVKISAIDTVSFEGVSDEFSSGAFSIVAATGIGNGGSINIITGDLTVTNGAGLIANTRGQGKAGTVAIIAHDKVSFDGVGSNGFASAAESQVETTGIGDGGSIDITTGSLFVTNGAVLNVNTRGQGKAGSLRITARDTVSFNNIGSAFSVVGEKAVGNGGDIDITTGSLFVTNGAGLNVITLGQGNAGNVKISATDTVLFDGVSSDGFSSGAFSTVVEGAIGKGGGVEITTRSLSVTGGAQLVASTFGQGDAGNVKISATDTVSFDGVGSNGFLSAASSTVEKGAIGKGGGVEITTRSLSVTGGAQLQASTSGQGDAGNVKISATDTVSFDGGYAFSAVEKGAIGKGGGVEITTKSLSVTGGAQLDTSTFGQGDAGNVKISATDTVSFDGGYAFSTMGKEAIGKGGGIDINTRSLTVTGGAQLAVSTFGQGNAGSVFIQATDSVSLAGGAIIFSEVERGATGDGGEINIKAGSFSLTDRAQLRTSVRPASLELPGGTGNAGKINIEVRESATIAGVGDEFTQISSFVGVGSKGNGGTISIKAESLSIENGAALFTATFGQGDAGSVSVQASDSVSLTASYISTQVVSGAEGKGGNIDIKGRSLSLTNGTEVLSATSGQGNAGNIFVQATDSVSLADSGIFSTVESGGVGKGGTIDIKAASLSLTNGAQLLTSLRPASEEGSAARGSAGNLNIDVRDTVSFDGVSRNGFSSGALSTVAEGAVGNGGIINITTNSFSLANGAELSATSLGNGAAGNINIKANSIRLSNQALLSADTVKGQGNITMESQSLILRRGSSITTNATGKATGGNIAIDTEVLAALENSDISANAEDSFGGRVTINAQGIFGTAFRSGKTSQSDITATSNLGPEFFGTVQINTPDVDPSSGLVELPKNVVDVSRLVAKGCVRRRGQTGTFYIVGTGGLPTRPLDAIDSRFSTGGVRSIPNEDASAESRSNSVSGEFDQGQTNDAIVEAQGIYPLENGQLVLSRRCPD